MRAGRLRSAAVAVLCIAVALLLALLPDTRLDLRGRSGSAFSATTSEQCLAIADRHFDARRSLQKSGRADHSAVLPSELRFACSQAVPHAPQQALVRVQAPQPWPSTARARAPPTA